jgi:cell wall-associated NlpC family hydrolase
VVPEPPALDRVEVGLRDKVVKAAMRFLGTPYRWGGPSAETGFDCSGLTMTAYRLNGLELPRASAEQYATGQAVSRDALKAADLVFFATGREGRPSHVGLYVGEGRFIHAPGSGKVVRIDDLSQDYYAQRFLGARSYLE